MRNWACALEFNVELGLRQKSKELFPFPFSFLISHLSFVISHFSFFTARERDFSFCLFI